MKLEIRSVSSNDEVIENKAIDVKNGSILILKANVDNVTAQEAHAWFENVVSVTESIGNENNDGVGVMYLPKQLDLMVLEVRE